MMSRPVTGPATAKDAVSRHCQYTEISSINSSSTVRNYFARESGCECCDECVCLSVCPAGSPEPHPRSLPNFLCMVPMSVVRSSSGMFMIGRIAYRLPLGMDFLPH